MFFLNIWQKNFNYMQDSAGGKIPIRSATAFSSLLLRGRPRAEGAEQAPVERTTVGGYFSQRQTCNTKKETEVSLRLSNFVLLK